MIRDGIEIVRKTIDIDTDIEKIIQDMADKKKWSFSFMSYVLLRQAIKEKIRKRKHSTQNNT